MNKIIHLQSLEETIVRLSENNTELQKDLVFEMESNKSLRNEKDLLKLRLKKSDEYQWICSMIIILLLICTVTFGLMFSKSEQNQRVISIKIDEVFVKGMKLINWSDIVNQRFLNHSQLEQVLHSRKKMQMLIDVDKMERINNFK